MNKIYWPVKYLLLLCLVVFFCGACKKSDPVKPDPDPKPVKKPTVDEVTTSVNTALAGKDTLSQFALDFKSAGLTQTEVENGITVFAPSNKAYTLKTTGRKKITAVTDVYLPDSSVVRDYIVSGKIDIAKITNGTSLTAISGKKLILTKVNDKWYVNGIFLNITVLSTGDNTVVFSLAGLFNTSTLPHITGVSSTKIFPGWLLTIYGGNLGAAVNKNVVKIDNITATIHTANADSIEITVPHGVTAGALTVTTQGRTVTMEQTLTVQKAHVTTVAGTGGGPVQGISIDAADNIYWTDNFYNGNVPAARLVKYSAGQISYYKPVFPNPNGDGTNIAVLNTKTLLWAIGLNSQNQVYFATESSSAEGYSGIFRSATATPTTAEWWAGTGTNYTATTRADLKVYTSVIKFDKQDNLYLLNSGGNLQKITPAGNVSIVIGNAEFLSADPNVQRVSSYGIALSGSKTYVSDATNGRIWIKDNNGLKVLAGNNTHVAKDGVGTAAQFGAPFGITLDNKGNLYVCDNDYGTSNFIIRMINPRGEVTTIAGGAGGGADVDGIGTAAGFNGVNTIAIDSKGALYVGTDAGTIRKITFQ
ncbi:fasciclin domain-containing protein [Mucilaginibacter sp. AK015]|uniref:fasciclin domain-containing protein n=1 Tax=Mucilaginibacter sp. AK015 TaxID=2723072 RepID=UPI00161736BC|nr:fasciclin domain-containing protein [Mucilaginibacter sp. AK015]MBB5396319.1 sugar lactone lactonase YvrE [Mucilaginibacter sp. AK015]